MAVFLLYVALVFVGHAVSKASFASPAVKSLLLLSPSLAIALTAFVIYRFFRASDEHFQLRMLQALTTSAAVVATISVGALSFIAVGVPILPLWLAWPIMATTMIIVGAVRVWRDRTAEVGAVNAVLSIARSTVPYLLAVALPLGTLYAIKHVFALTVPPALWVLAGVLPYMALFIRKGARVARGDEK
jgi:hypothetical protein